VPVAARPLLAELIGYLEDRGLDPDRRAHAEAVLVDLLRPVTMTTIDVRLPAEQRARQVAQALTDDPADRRTLAEWGRQVGASERTLARGFVAGTGLAFGRWRARLRLQAALPALAAGQPVGNRPDARRLLPQPARATRVGPGCRQQPGGGHLARVTGRQRTGWLAPCTG
jgi:anti-sigma factor RsiW